MSGSKLSRPLSTDRNLEVNKDSFPSGFIDRHGVFLLAFQLFELVITRTATTRNLESAAKQAGNSSTVKVDKSAILISEIRSS